MQSFLTKTSVSTRNPCFGAERNFAILSSEAHQLHLVVHRLRRSRVGVLKNSSRGAALHAEVDSVQSLTSNDS